MLFEFAGVLALHLGGKDHAALLTNIFDGAGFLPATYLSVVAMKLSGERRWVHVYAHKHIHTCIHSYSNEFE
jgi:hypothetical protein